MKKLVALAAAVAAAAVVVAAPASAGPSAIPTYSVSGIETGIPQSGVSPFAGVASAPGDVGVWSASVAHDALSNCITPSSTCTITGGTFTLSGLHGTIAGTFDAGGTIRPETVVAGCTNERYDVDGSLTTNAGTAHFDAVLTHYQARIFGVCVTYFATVTGTFGP